MQGHQELLWLNPGLGAAKLLPSKPYRSDERHLGRWGSAPKPQHSCPEFPICGGHQGTARFLTSFWLYVLTKGKK